MTNSKRLLRFYFKADELDGALNNLILSNACRSAACEGRGAYYAERIIALTEAKSKLSALWQYLDGVMLALKSEDVEPLKRYAFMRCGIRRLELDEQHEIKRAVIKFTRHARSLERYADGMRLVGEYYCLT